MSVVDAWANLSDKTKDFMNSLSDMYITGLREQIGAPSDAVYFSEGFDIDTWAKFVERFGNKNVYVLSTNSHDGVIKVTGFVDTKNKA